MCCASRCWGEVDIGNYDILRTLARATEWLIAAKEESVGVNSLEDEHRTVSEWQ
jgi:hypothetical protein